MNDRTKLDQIISLSSKSASYDEKGIRI
jgi:hypothetical protein